jgi:hypothetical protein
MSMQNHGGMMSTEEDSWFIYQSSLVILPAELSSRQSRELAKEIMYLALRSICIHTSKGFLTCLKVLRHGADDFTSLPKKVVLRVFIVLKNPSPSAGFEPANLGSRSKHANHYTTDDDYDTLLQSSAVNILIGVLWGSSETSASRPNYQTTRCYIP